MMRTTAFNVTRWTLAVLGLVLCGRVAAAGLEATLDRTRLAEGDTVTLSLTAPGDAAGSPDFSPLKADFDILDQGQSTRMTIVNGQSSSTREWRLVLSPKRSGRLTVPPLRVGGLSSAPLSLEVVQASQSAQVGQSRAVLLEVQADPKGPYVQGQVVYTVRLLYRVPLRQASLSEPSADDAIIQRLGEDKKYSTYRDGERYQVIERRYAVFPQHSGTLRIDAPMLSASVPDQSRPRSRLRDRFFGSDAFGDFDRFFGRDPFQGMDSFFEQTRPVRVRGRNLSLDVKPQPAAAPSPWLPAESLQLSETWSPDHPVFRVGEPVTRTIAITAQGVSAAQLPDLAPAVPAEVKVYPDKSQTQTRAEGDDLVAMKVIKFALVPSAAGKMTLPEVRLSWWDTQSNQQRVAVLPAHTFDVLPARPGVAASPATPAPALSPANGREAVAPALQAIGGAESPADSQDGRPEGGYWPWVALALGVIWLGTMGLWVRDRGRLARGGAAAPAQQPVKPMAADIGRARARVKQACTQGDRKAAREALLGWAAARWPDAPPRRLEILAEHLGGAAGDALRDLDRQLYGSGGEPWDGLALWSRIGPSLAGNGEKKTSATPGDQVLPDLYPRHG